MKILKFGGSSIATPERIKEVVSTLVARFKKKEVVYVVFSAFGGVTDSLIKVSEKAKKGEGNYIELFEELKERHFKIIDQLISENRSDQVNANVFRLWDELQSLLHGICLLKELTLRTLDCIMSFGERLSSYIITQIIKEQFLDVETIDARKVIITDNNFGNVRVLISETYENIKKYHENHQQSQIVTGFIASTKEGETTTLGRGGSDYTAALFAAALDVEVLEIWTDVNGVMTADPRKVSEAFSIPEMTYEEAMEISHFGAKVIYPPTMHPVLTKKIPLQIKNTLAPDNIGTWIRENNKMKQPLIKGISSIDSIALIRVQGSGMIGITGVSGRLFSALARESINIILITQASSEHTICFAVSSDSAFKARSILENEFSLEMLAEQIDNIVVEENLSIVAVVGEKMRHRPGISKRLFYALGNNGVNCIAIAQGSSELNISVVIKQIDEKKALNAVHDAFFLSEIKTIHLFFIGVGLVGKTLLSQIYAKEQELLEKQKLKIQLVAIGNSKKMVFGNPTLPFSNPTKVLKDSTTTMDISLFIEKIYELNLPNSIFVDCTANENITLHYKDLLKNNISIVTPNKKANSSSYEYYKELQKLTSHRGAKFYYETNVGAGLPVINTMKDLLQSGDEIIKIEAVLSGTLSYLFNTFNEKIPFSQLVQQAQKKGFTEPDPRDDLNGIDVARKILILARESGYPMEIKDIYIENLVNEHCVNAETIPSFYTELEKMDPLFLDRLKHTLKQGKKMCYVGQFEKGKGSVSLQSIAQNHPFYQLQGSDNMIIFTTKRYLENPLVIKGPGAGAEVTAAGIFADIMRVYND